MSFSVKLKEVSILDCKQSLTSFFVKLKEVSILECKQSLTSFFRQIKGRFELESKQSLTSFFRQIEGIETKFDNFSRQNEGRSFALCKQNQNKF